MKTEATVVRVEHANGSEGFAVVIESVSLAEGSSELCVERDMKATEKSRMSRDQKAGPSWIAGIIEAIEKAGWS